MITLNEQSTQNFEWTKYKEKVILLNNDLVGYISYWVFDKKSIYNEIYEDHAFYMDEDTHMKEETAQFILNRIGELPCIYIDEIYINKDNRGFGIGSSIINELELEYQNTSIVLRIGPTREDIAKVMSDESYSKELSKKLDNFYKKLGFRNQDTIYFKNI